MEELMTINNAEVITDLDVSGTSDSRFMVANTQSIPYQLLQQKCTIPVFSKDNESTISHQEFIEVVGQAANLAFAREQNSIPEMSGRFISRRTRSK